MRILYDHHLFSRQYAGGATRYFYELMRYLSGIPEVEVEFLMGSSATVCPFRDLSSANTRVRAFNGPPLPGVWRYAANEALGECIAPFLGRMDVYHPTLYSCMPMVRTRRVVATHHDCTPERFPQEFRHTDRVIRAKRGLYERADALICVSESCRRDLLEFYEVDPAKTRIIYHGVSKLPRCPEAGNLIRQKTRREFLLYVGSRTCYKNFTGLLQAFCETGLHESLDLLVLGGGPLTAEERALMADLKLSDCVVSIEEVSDTLLGEAYAGAKLFVYPSLWEGFGFPPLEAMAAGCPVLASNTSSIPEVCLDAPFYFDPQDQASFNRALLCAINDEEARRQAIEKGNKVAARYSWSKCGEQTLALYHGCQ